MSTVSLICIRCRMRIRGDFRTRATLSNASLRIAGYGAPAASRWSFLHGSRFYSARSDDTPESPRATPTQKDTSKPDYGPFADPVMLKLSGKVERFNETKEDFKESRKKGLSPADVESFLSLALEKKVTEKTVTLSESEAHQIDMRYGELLGDCTAGSQSGAKQREREALAPETPPPPMEVLLEKFKYPAATHAISELLSPPEDSPLWGKEVVIHGFVKSVRKLTKALIFVDFTDYTASPGGAIQIVSNLSSSGDIPEKRRKQHSFLKKIPPFTPLCVRGKMTKPTKRAPNKPITPDLVLESYNVLNTVSPSQIHIPETVYPPEKRHMQLRTDPLLAKALRIRHRVLEITRRVLSRNKFLEIETPLLFKSTPEGAREFLVPSRNSGKCYALPQSPQQYKQILMASGVNNYFQVAKCFRDEDLRADRQPEFTQLDLEMGFAKGRDVMQIVQQIICELWWKVLGHNISEEHFKMITYSDAMRSYGTDKPDLRFHNFKVHKITLTRPDGSHEILDALFMRARKNSVGRMEELRKCLIKEHRGDGSGKFTFKTYVAGEASANGVPEENLTAGDIEQINEHLRIDEGDLVIIRRRDRKGIQSVKAGKTVMGIIRETAISKALELGILSPPSGYEFLWVIDFPLFTITEANSNEPGQASTVGLQSTHHPFTAPHEQDFHMLAHDPLAVRAEHYDLVVNGVELGGGSRRIHDPELQKYILEKVIRVHPDKLHQFDHLIEALGSGCPPHAGIALGLDRLVATMVGTNSIRDVIAFPKNSKGVDPLVDSPSEVSEKDLKVYGLNKSTP